LAGGLIDAEGRIRHHHFSERDYENSERVIQTLLAQAGYRNAPGGFVAATAAPAPDGRNSRSSSATRRNLASLRTQSAPANSYITSTVVRLR
jgi:hypothetical protein